MKIDIQARGLTLGSGLKRFVKRRIDFAFSTRAEQISGVTIRLADVNGARGGRGKSCLVQVRVAGLPDVVVENIEENLFVATHRAVDRAGWTVTRKLERQRRKARARLLIEQQMSRRDEPDWAA